MLARFDPKVSVLRNQSKHHPSLAAYPHTTRFRAAQRTARDAPRAPAVQIAQPVRHQLYCVSSEFVLVHQHRIVRGPARALYPSVAVQEEIELELGRDASVDDGSRQHVPGPVLVPVVRWEEARVVPLLNNYKCDGRGVVGALVAELLAGLRAHAASSNC